MRLLPADTIRVSASTAQHASLHARIRQADFPTLQKIATGAWVDYIHEDMTILVSTKQVRDMLYVEMYENIQLHIPPSTKQPSKQQTKHRLATQQGKAKNAIPLSLRINAVKMLPGKGSSVARRAILTLEVLK